LSIEIRPATPSDATAVSTLLNDLGYRVPPEQARASLSTLDLDGADPVFLAVDKDHVAGLLALHVARWLQLERPIARITALMVQAKYQRRGIGKQLVQYAGAFASGAGCGTLELTTGIERGDAHQFYRDQGFDQTSVRFKKALA
jgi:GNAT superfamily N-acetyltransferase